MSSNKNIDQKVERALESMEGHIRATPGPFLMTRIRAGLAAGDHNTLWDRFYALITRPVVAMTGLAIILLLNVFILTSENDSDSVKFQTESGSDWQVYSNSNTSALYDVENMEP